MYLCQLKDASHNRVYLYPAQPTKPNPNPTYLSVSLSRSNSHPSPLPVARRRPNPNPATRSPSLAQTLTGPLSPSRAADQTLTLPLGLPLSLKLSPVPSPRRAAAQPCLSVSLSRSNSHRTFSPSRRYRLTQPQPLCPVSLYRARCHPSPLSPSVPLLVSVRRLSTRQRRWRREAKRVVVRRRSPLSLSPVIVLDLCFFFNLFEVRVSIACLFKFVGG